MSAFYKADPDQILVVLDDLALPTGRLRARAGGSAGGHNGLADVLEALGHTQMPRLRIGIGQAPPNMDSTDYVLRPFEADEREIIETAVQQAADAVEDWVFNGIEFVMDKYNGN
jgi:PTH1 family peptidyl-tRNA hydrolase